MGKINCLYRYNLPCRRNTNTNIGAVLGFSAGCHIASFTLLFLSQLERFLIRLGWEAGEPAVTSKFRHLHSTSTLGELPVYSDEHIGLALNWDLACQPHKSFGFLEGHHKCTDPTSFREEQDNHLCPEAKSILVRIRLQEWGKNKTPRHFEGNYFSLLCKETFILLKNIPLSCSDAV